MTVSTEDYADLDALKELADDILSAGTEPVLDNQRVGIDYLPELWNTLAQSGLTLLNTPESRGGTGAGLRELAVVLERSGYHAAPLPLAEHDLLASWLLEVAGLPNVDGAMTAAVADCPLIDGRLVATIEDVPWANAAATIVVAGPGFVAAVPTSHATLRDRPDIAGQPLARIQLDTTPSLDRVAAMDVDLAREFRLRGALARSLQTCGALSRALDLTIEHAQQRRQFGRPIAKFQAVQALISTAAAALTQATTAAHFATEVVTGNGFDSEAGHFATAVAKIEAARAATLIARHAHQVHGAIGFTLDHRLRHFTNRALAWRSEFGTQREWQHDLGTMVAGSTESVWELVTRLSTGVAATRVN
jgi:acyl-CoA dehydrogenase